MENLIEVGTGVNQLGGAEAAAESAMWWGKNNITVAGQRWCKRGRWRDK